MGRWKGDRSAPISARDAERFWRRVEHSGLGDHECWPWPHYRDRKGYGRFQIKGYAEIASRVSWTISHNGGRWPQSHEFVLHSCDNPPCVNPQHLRLGDHSANGADRTERRRSAGACYDPTHERWPHRKSCKTCQEAHETEPILCECGTTILRRCLTGHRRTRAHVLLTAQDPPAHPTGLTVTPTGGFLVLCETCGVVGHEHRENRYARSLATRHERFAGASPTQLAAARRTA